MLRGSRLKNFGLVVVTITTFTLIPIGTAIAAEPINSTSSDITSSLNLKIPVGQKEIVKVKSDSENKTINGISVTTEDLYPKTGDYFLDSISTDAINVAREFNIYPSVLMAQAMIESASGTSGLTVRYNNYFGVKGAGAEFDTTEYIDGEAKTVKASFAAYPSRYASFRAYANLVSGYPYYGATRDVSDTPYKAINSIAGMYATSPTYYQTISNTIRRFGLERFDKLVDFNYEYDEVVIKTDDQGNQTQEVGHRDLGGDGAVKKFAADLKSNPELFAENVTVLKNDQISIDENGVASASIGDVLYTTDNKKVIITSTSKAFDVQSKTEIDIPQNVKLIGRGSKLFNSSMSQANTNFVIQKAIDELG